MTEIVTTLPLPLRRKLYLSSDVDATSMEDLSSSIIDINDSDNYLEKLYKISKRTKRSTKIIVRVLLLYTYTM